MLRRTLRLFDYHIQRAADRAVLVISKKEVAFDHVGVDVSGLVGVGLRLTKNVASETRRHREVARHVGQGVQAILKRFHPVKSLALFMDGSEGLWKAHRTRSSTVSTKRTESRLMRLPATALMQAVEERLIRALPDSRMAPEIVFSGTCCEGSVEQKLSAWALDLACRPAFSPTQPLLLVGGGELHLQTLALTPYYNISNVVQSNSDFKQIHIQNLLEWLGCGEHARQGENTYLARVRTDAVFLQILFHGASASEMPALQGGSFAAAMDMYFALAGKPTVGSTRAEGTFLFMETDGKLTLDLRVLLAVIETPRQPFSATYSAAADDHLELALQTHAMFCHGELPASRWLCREAGAPTLAALGGHLKHLVAEAGNKSLSKPDDCRSLDAPAPQPLAAVFRAARREAAVHSLTTGPLTAAEFTILSHPQTRAVETLLQQYAGRPLSPEVAKTICPGTGVPVTPENTAAAAPLLRKALCCAPRPHRCTYLAPSYCWLQHERSKQWSFSYIDLGARQRKRQIRQRRHLEAGAALALEADADGPAVFNAVSNLWEPIPAFPFYCPPAPADEPQVRPTNDPPPSQVGAAAVVAPPRPRALSVLTWNVMFDRYSGKPTPLGMPGIDWCSRQRYPVLAKLIQQCDADVIGLQEVEPVFWEYLAALPWVRQQYIFSCNAGGPAINPWGVLQMVHRRLPVSAITHHNIPAWSGHINLMPVVTLPMAHGPVHVASMHLLAPYTKGHEDARVGQDTALRQRMQRTITGDCITMGDFNDWPTNEFRMPVDSDYTDAWTLLRPDDPGKTMDETNEFAKLKIEEMFFGRSDKIFFRSRALRPTAANLVGTRSVNVENGDSQAPGYLFPSDHYGIFMRFELP